MEMPDVAVSKWRRHTEPNMALVEKLRGEMVREYESQCSLYGAGVAEEGRHCRGKFHGGLVDIAVQTETEALALGAGSAGGALAAVPPVGFAPLAHSGEQPQRFPQPLPPSQGVIQLDDIDLTRLSSTASIDGQSGRLAVLLYRLPPNEPRPSAAPAEC